MTTIVRKHRVMPEVSSLMGDFMDDFFFRSPALSGKAFVPAVNIKEDEKAYAIHLAVPGMKKEQFKLELDQNVLTIAAEQRTEHQEDKEHFHREEFGYQGFSRSFTLPRDRYDAERIQADYTDGVLKITIPKVEQAVKGTRLISVQ
jgi:HSP20 family protein